MERTAEWLSYLSTPTGSGIAALVAVTSLQNRGALVEAVERYFFENGNWRVAQHAAMLHLDSFQPFTEQVDLVKALCFAEHACILSKEDPRARLVMGRVSWERRLPLAVLHDVETARAGEVRLRAELDGHRVEKVLAGAFLLEGLALAYLSDVNRAHQSLIEAERLGWLTVEAVVQLLFAAEPNFPEASMWAVSRIPGNIDLGGQAGARQLWALRRFFIALLRRRGLNGERC